MCSANALAFSPVSWAYAEGSRVPGSRKACLPIASRVHRGGGSILACRRTGVNRSGDGRGSPVSRKGCGLVNSCGLHVLIRLFWREKSVNVSQHFGAQSQILGTIIWYILS